MRTKLLIATALMLWGTPCRGDDWTITPSVSLYESYTSNASLNPIGQGNPDFFTTLVPAVDIRGDTSRLKLNFDYSLAAIAYVDNPNLDQLRVADSQIEVRQRAQRTAPAEGATDSIIGSPSERRRGPANSRQYRRHCADHLQLAGVGGSLLYHLSMEY